MYVRRQVQACRPTPRPCVISPSIVGDRFIQLTPVYKGGARARRQRPPGHRPHRDPAGARPDLRQPQRPLRRARARGRQQDRRQGVGALTRLLDSTARNFGGQGVKFNETLHEPRQAHQDAGRQQGRAVRHRSRGRGVRRRRWPSNDTTVRQFNDSLAAAADLLAGERQDLAAALQQPRHGDGRGPRLRQGQQGRCSPATSAASTTFAKVIVKQRAALDETLTTRPTALNNLCARLQPAHRHARHPRQHRRAVNQLQQQPRRRARARLVGARQRRQDCDADNDALKLPPRRAPSAGKPAAPAARSEPVDRSLGGLVEVTR